MTNFETETHGAIAAAPELEKRESKPTAVKNIVICCDGTGNEYGEENTNVVKILELLDNGDPRKQIAYYDPGVGTFSSPAVFTKPAKWFSKLWGKAFATDITTNVEDAYRYLMDWYHPGDRLYFFGFSRGAFTVRALGGMLKKCGLLHHGSYNLISYATNMYRRGDDKIAEGFKKTFSRPCDPHFIGVWDTVESVGISFFKRRFTNQQLNPLIPFGYQALAIDERRKDYVPNIWESAASGQTIEQVWFPGVHSDIGGSYKETGLSDAALLWMVQRAKTQGLMVHDHLVGQVKPNYADVLHTSYKGLWLLRGSRLRPIPENSKFHISVQQRINDPRLNYRPKNVGTVPPDNWVS